jgi:predicted ATP-grasp superfamily ATP-dependent carboligase
LRDPHDLYELSGEFTDPATAERAVADLHQPVLIQALSGFVDAGAAARLAREHLLTTLESTVVATFDADLLLDYRSRRPVMDFVEDHWESYDEPRLDIHALRDGQGTPFLLLAGPEPDLHWERFVAAVIAIIDRLGVRVTVGLNAIPMAVPHTRPMGVTAHASRRELIAGYEPWLQRVRVPGSAGHLLEFRLSQRGSDAIGYAAHVPHYLAQTDYPTAAETLLTSISKATGLLLPMEDLRRAAEELRVTIDEQVEASDEVRGVVSALEQQYDAFVRGREGPNLLAAAGPLPTAEELGAELERFLAEHGGPAEGPRPPA